MGAHPSHRGCVADLDDDGVPDDAQGREELERRRREAPPPAAHVTSVGPITGANDLRVVLLAQALYGAARRPSQASTPTRRRAPSGVAAFAGVPAGGGGGSP